MKKRSKILVIGLVWPEPTSSAAGWRLLQLIAFFKERQYEIHFASAAAVTAYSFPLETLQITTRNIQINDGHFDDYVADLCPDIVLFDRFVTEEQFGWRVRKAAPNAMTILDTEDLHFVRKARELSYKTKEEVNYYTTDAKRELASILRSDLSLIISQTEMELLQNTFQISPSLLVYLPFLQPVVSSKEMENMPAFANRSHFMFIGNYMHEPNYQTFLRLKNEVWPLLKTELPEAELHIYGAYATQKITQHHSPKDRFLVKGRAVDVVETMKKYSVLLAPIPFGAGMKGKFIDAMQSGLPNVTHSAGIESMSDINSWPGFVSDDLSDFVADAKELYLHSDIWTQKQQLGFELYNKKFDASLYTNGLEQLLHHILADLSAHRNKHFISQILNTNQHNAFKYMSLWIEEKNKDS